MDRWTLSDREVSRLLRAMDLATNAGSPLWRGPQADPGGHAQAVQPTPELRRALDRLAAPTVVMGVMACPPDDAVYHWLYGANGEEALVWHFANALGEHEIAWPFPSVKVLEDLEGALALDGPSVADDLSRTIDRVALMALAALVDLREEDVLLSLLHRGRSPDPSFDAEDLLACFHRSLRGDDLRWTAQRLRLVSPVILEPSKEEMERGLDWLRRHQVVETTGGRFTLTDGFVPFALSLGHFTGMGAVSLHLRAGEEEEEEGWTWTRRHLAILRSTTRLTVLDFQDVKEEDFSVVLSCKSPEAVRSLLEMLLRAKHTGPTPAAAPTVVTGGLEEAPIQSTVPSASPPVEATQRTEVPAPPVASEPETESESSGPARTCPECRAPLRPNLGFCTSCGARLRSAGGDQPGSG